MENFPTFQEYLQRQSPIVKDNEEALVAMKKQWQKARRKFYHEREKSQTRRVYLTLSKQEFLQVNRAAKRRGQKVAVYGKEVLLREADFVPLMPDASGVKAIHDQLNRAANNVNQLVRKCHQFRGYAVTQGTATYLSEGEELAVKKAMNGLTTGNTFYKKMVEEIRAMQTQIQAYVTTVPDLYAGLQADLLAHPENIEKVQTMLASLTTSNTQTHTDNDNQKQDP